MRFVFAIFFFVACMIFIMFRSADVITAWTAWSNPDQISFEKSDPKLLLVWVVLLTALIAYVVWPESFQPQPQISGKQAWTMGFAVAGILGGFQALTGGNYLAAAEQHAANNGYVRCSDEVDIIMGHLDMAKSPTLCDQDKA